MKKDVANCLTAYACPTHSLHMPSDTKEGSDAGTVVEKPTNLALDRKLVALTKEFVKKKRRESISSLVEKLLVKELRRNGVRIPQHLQ